MSKNYFFIFFSLSPAASFDFNLFDYCHCSHIHTRRYTNINLFILLFHSTVISLCNYMQMGTTYSSVSIVSVHFLMFLSSSPVENNLEWMSKDGNNLLKFDNCCRYDDRWSAGRLVLFPRSFALYSWLLVVKGIKTFSPHAHICSFNKQHKLW